MPMSVSTIPLPGLPSPYIGTPLLIWDYEYSLCSPSPSPLCVVHREREVLHCVCPSNTIAPHNTGQEVTVFGGANVSIDTTNWPCPGPQSPGHSLCHSTTTTTVPYIILCTSFSQYSTFVRSLRILN